LDDCAEVVDCAEVDGGASLRQLLLAEPSFDANFLALMEPLRKRAPALSRLVVLEAIALVQPMVYNEDISIMIQDSEEHSNQYLAVIKI